MTLISCDDRIASGGVCKITDAELRDMNLLSENPDFHRIVNSNPVLKFNFWCSTLNPDSVELPKFRNKFR